MKGKFITVEGPDGAGKTTQLAFIERRLRQRGLEPVMTREPGGTGLGEELRAVLLNHHGSPICADAELLMMFAARAQHIDERILPALAAGQWVVSDRFTDASYAYQGGGRGIPQARLESLESWVQADFQPDLTLLLDVPVAIGLQRAGGRGEADDRFEQEAIAFKEAVREAYLQRAQSHPRRIRVVDASGTIEEVQSVLSAILDDFCRLQEVISSR
ncbi:MAG: dTMP kinase [Pseudomonadota bacterium]|nr:dTMP kinase [Pseudomonadota bacterium]